MGPAFGFDRAFNDLGSVTGRSSENITAAKKAKKNTKQNRRNTFTVGAPSIEFHYITAVRVLNRSLSVFLGAFAALRESKRSTSIQKHQSGINHRQRKQIAVEAIEPASMAGQHRPAVLHAGSSFQSGFSKVA